MLSNGRKATYWEKLENNLVKCTLCPHYCILREDVTGICQVRKNIAGHLLTFVYGHASGFCMDPIEKKPLYHFFPGSSTFSFGTVGCNLKCKFCQNSEITASTSFARLVDRASPEMIATAALEQQAISVSFTYNEPVIFAEYAIDTAIECHKKNIHTVAVTAGYISKEARKDFFTNMDAANVDLKGFSERFYKDMCGAKLNEVLDTLTFIKNETKTWLELTTLIIPNENDSEKELTSMSQWVYKNLGPNVPWHFSAFHPAHKYLENIPTPLSTLTKARRIAIDNGINFVYTGNVSDVDTATTYCPKCKAPLIERYGFNITSNEMTDGQCSKCAFDIPGYYTNAKSNFGNKRKPFKFFKKQ